MNDVLLRTIAATYPTMRPEAVLWLALHVQSEPAGDISC